MDKVIVVQHVRKITDDFEDVKMIDVYKSYQDAQAVVKRLRNLPGFRDCESDYSETGEGFSVEEYELGKDHWVEGFSFE